MKYAIKQLLYKKYGEEKYAIACEISARWVAFETKNKNYKLENILLLCNASKDSDCEMSYQEALALKKLFGLKTIEELYN